MNSQSDRKLLANELQLVGSYFRLEGLFFDFEKLTMGNINETYRVDYIADDGSGFAKIKSYLFQRVSTVAFNNPEQLMSNIEKVTEHLHWQNPKGKRLHFHHTEERKNYIELNGSVWRVRNWVDSVTFNKCENLEVLKRTGEAFGAFQGRLSDFDASTLYYTIPDFHNTRLRYLKLKDAVDRNEFGRVDSVKEEIDWLMSEEEHACKLTDMEKIGQLPLRVTHNDTKINNVLFDRETLAPLFVIDLDTVMPGLVGYDFGDAIRFAANFMEEDSEELEKVGLDLNAFDAFAEGFLSQTARTLTENEVATLADSCFAITCELAVRFLTDYIDGDRYFTVKKDKHNLIRTRCQIALAKSMQKKRHPMQAICEEYVRVYRKTKQK